MERLETSKQLIKECIKDLYLTPRSLLRKWSRITNQTSQVRLAYAGQHLASLITGIKGRGTAARGDDLSDGSEVKVCSRADQLSECRSCGANVLPWQKTCSECGSKDIDIKTDSHWIFSIKSEEELEMLLKRIPRIILILFDMEETRKKIRVRAWTMDPKNKYIIDFYENYYHENYLKKRQPAPCNLHPLMYDFYLMYPGLIFHAEIDLVTEEITIVYWDFEKPLLEKMPSHLLRKKQLVEMFKSQRKGLAQMSKDDIVTLFPFVPENERSSLSMREKILKEVKEKYVRESLR